ncbi:MAG: hypothetical protein AMXMBFR47_35990 [Planctomycetota bacterium]
MRQSLVRPANKLSSDPRRMHEKLPGRAAQRRWIAAAMIVAVAVPCIADLPLITQQPQNRIVGAADAVTFFVEVQSATPVTYQWSKDSSPLSGETGPELTINPASSSDAGSYSVTVTNVDGSVSSDDAALTYSSAPWTSRASVASTGAQNNDNSSDAVVSGNGRYIAFASPGDTLVPGLPDDVVRLYRRDRQTGRTMRVDGASSWQANGATLTARISSDSRWRALASDATNLVPNDVNGVRDVFLLDTNTNVAKCLSVGAGGQPGNALSDDPAVSSNADRVVFASAADNLVTGDTNGAWDIFLFTRATGLLERISLTSGGGEADGDSFDPTISMDGRHVVFTSAASNLVAADTNGVADVFHYDSQTGVTTRVSVDSSGAEGDGASDQAEISPNGAQITFRSMATDLVADDTNGRADIFAHNPATGATVLLSRTPASAPADGDSSNPSISLTGRWIACESDATDLVTGDTNGLRDVFIIDRDIENNGVFDDSNAVIVRASVRDGSGQQLSAPSGSPQISYNGAMVAYDSDADNIVDNDTNGTTDVFLFRPAFTSAVRVSVGPAGQEGNGPSHVTAIDQQHFVAIVTDSTTFAAADYNGVADLIDRDIQLNQTILRSRGWLGNANSGSPSISADGALVAFATLADIFPEDGPGSAIILHDFTNDTFELVSTGSSGAAANDASYTPAISSDGRYVAFTSAATNLVAGITGLQVYLKDRQTGAVELISQSTGGTASSDQANCRGISGDGRFVLFDTTASNLVANDSNGRRDAFVRDRQTGQTILATLGNGAVQPNSDSVQAVLSADGRYVAFTTAATNLDVLDTNGQSDVYLRDLQTGSTSLISVSLSGTAASGAHPALSADSQLVFFDSSATNLIVSDANPLDDVYIRKLAYGVTRVVSVNSAGQQVSGQSTGAAVSADGRFIAFRSTATTLVGGDTNNRADIFVRDDGGCAPPEILVQPVSQVVFLGDTVTLTVAANGSDPLEYQWRYDGNEISGATDYRLVLSEVDETASGNYDVVVSNGCGLAISDPANLDVEGCRPTTQLVSAGPGGFPVEAIGVAISDDGRHVVFSSRAGVLLPNVGSSGQWHVYAYDRQTDVVTCLSVRPDGSPNTSGNSFYPVLSPDGRFAVFQSDSRQLVDGTQNTVRHVYLRDRDPDENGVFDEGNGVTERISVASDSSLGNDNSGGIFRHVLSADARYVAFISRSGNLAPNGTFVDQVYLRDRQAGTTVRISDAAGMPGNLASESVAIGPDGQFIAFSSLASNLVTGDVNNASDVFRFDAASGQVILISVNSSGTQGNGASRNPAITADGVTIAFESSATNLVSGDSNAAADIFSHSVQTGATTRVSVGAAGVQANGDSNAPVITPDGAFLAFYSRASNLLTGGDTNSAYDAFVLDMQTGSISRASESSAGAGGNGDSGSATDYIAISSDGRYIGFNSVATNLGSPAVGVQSRVYLRDQFTAECATMSVSGAGVPANGLCELPAIDTSGRWVAFRSLASNLVPADTNGAGDIFVLDRTTGEIVRASTAADAGQATGGDSGNPALSGDGRYVAFQSAATNLVPDDTNGVRDVFVKSLETGAIARASVSSGGIQGNNNSGSQQNRDIAISSEGRFVVFASAASNLVASDVEGRSDIFVHDRDPDANGTFDEGNGVTARISIAPDGSGGNGESYSPRITGDGRYVAFQSDAFNLHVNANPGGLIYRFDRMLETMEIVSRTTGGENLHNVRDPSISDDGNLVAFAYRPAPDPQQILVRDMTSGAVTLVSASVTGQACNGACDSTAISGDGQFVSFGSGATNLVANDLNGRFDVFIRDLGGGTTIRASLGNSGQEATQNSGLPAISGNGHAVAFSTLAPNIFSGVTFTLQQIGLNDRNDCAPPTILQQPNDATGDEGTRIDLEVSAVANPSPSYQWHKDGQAVPGATHRRLTILSLSPNEVGQYSVIVSNALGSVESSPAHVQLNTPCTADLNGDDRVDLVDLAQLLSHFGTPSGATLPDGDIDGDGDVDLGDLSTLLSRFGIQC